MAHLDDERLAAAYAAGDGLCLKHLLQAVDIASEAVAFRALVTPQEQRYLAMLGDLDEYKRKRHHRFSQERYGAEGDVWLRAMNAIVGGTGMGLRAGSGGRGQGGVTMPASDGSKESTEAEAGLTDTSEESGPASGRSPSL